MRIYAIDLQTRAARQLIPDALDPALPNYRDEQVAWLRSRWGTRDLTRTEASL